MTDTGQVPAEGLPENAGMVEQPGVPTHGAYTYLSETTAEDEDLLLLPGAQSAWGNEVAPPAPAPVVEAVHEPGPHETGGRDSGSVDLSAVRLATQSSVSQVAAPIAPRRPLHLGPPTPDASTSPVRSLADRGPAGMPAPARQFGTPARAPGPEYLDAPPLLAEAAPQGAAPWGAQAPAQTAVQTAQAPLVSEVAHPAETVVPLLAETPAPEPAPETAEVPEQAEPEPALQETTPEASYEEPEGAYETPEPAAPSAAHSPENAYAFETPQSPDSDVAIPAAGDPEVDAAFPATPVTPEAAHAPYETEGAMAQPEDALVVAPEAESVVAEAEPVLDAPVAPEEPAVPDTQLVPDVPMASEAQFAPEAYEETAAQIAPQAAPESEPQALDPGAYAEAPAAPAGEVETPSVAEELPLAHFVDPASQPADSAAQVTEAGTLAEPLYEAVPAEASAPVMESVAVEGQAEEQTAEQTAEQTEGQAEGQAAEPEAAFGQAAPSDQAPTPAGPAIPDPEPVVAVVPAAEQYTEPGEEPTPFAEPAEQPEPLAEPAFAEPVGEFVPVDGTVPTTPYLVPTPPHGLVLLPEDAHTPAPAIALRTPQPEPEAAEAEVPAPQEAEPTPEPVAAALDEEPEPALLVPAPDLDAVQVAQQAEDLDTRVAEQEEHEESPVTAENVRESTGPAAPGYDDAEREAVLKVMRERRDIRNGFRSDPIPHDVLLRVLEAAHTAPSVGHSQPWDFVVIRSAETRGTMHELAERQREAYARSLPKGRAKQFKELKIEAILDTPVNIVVTADPTRGGRHTLGRHTQPQMAPYSSALAVENLWLAARAEGLGVGWVSFFDEREMVRALGLPEHLEVVAYLCVGYVDEFPEEPELMQAGWSKRRPLSWVVHEETYGRRALPGAEPHDLLAETVANIRPLDAKALGEAWERQKRMTKPAGALGMLEIISAQLSGLSRMCPPPIPEPAAVAIFAGDHGVHAQGVTPWPQEVTAQMVANFLGGGAVCNAFANQVGAEVCVIDVGVASDLPATPGLLPRKIRAGTSDMTTGPAMTREEAKAAIEVGIETARDLVAAGNKALLTGEMGIANTTASAALISVFTDTDPAEVTGRGTGINDETLARKTEVVRRAIDFHQPDPADPIGVLAAIGGFEHAAMVGLLLGGASLRTPVILDGVSAGAAALVARAIAPEVLAACIAGHRSAEPGHVAALNKLGLRPLIDLDLRLGEGTGALLALPMVQSTARAMHEVATFDSAGVTEK
ncbi:nicotinate-nucleotide--dimethylbenzimidazole phosphoribosyltransferase [Streptomyces lacrimifluminis]|uniref:Nicotinate-nucleotide--dimethylbenzimidazole phosphoribosyltransferase n=1 Tax=Streptomyces lacrimifluminis TaxID=1500077 RepID=A0A917KMU0_9ACTN|nr:nicotinate-nucleotide--dimethylbenzimidazole phosphoribosyltransferase [Streptomyces lacrimifluminis]GGJ18169.1 nicotinate-nucleotide--dimethylbenzimidazole phosphoribosyltransferase [Streptomyces lacrimifluminis]